MKRPRYINYQVLRESKLLDYSTDQDKYIDQLEFQLKERDDKITMILGAMARGERLAKDIKFE